ncbi:UNVERIFIED_CONTAM: hypothetical protein RMT77_010916 [Armadillidium vulgare]
MQLIFVVILAFMTLCAVNGQRVQIEIGVGDGGRLDGGSRFGGGGILDRGSRFGGGGILDRGSRFGGGGRLVGGSRFGGGGRLGNNDIVITQPLARPGRPALPVRQVLPVRPIVQQPGNCIGLLSLCEERFGIAKTNCIDRVRRECPLRG